MTDVALSCIYNYRPVDEWLSTSGQPSVAQLGCIAAAGFITIINLALHDDPRYSQSDETATAQTLGLAYVHIPVQFANPTETDLLAFFRLWRNTKVRKYGFIALRTCEYQRFLVCIAWLGKAGIPSERLS